MLSESDNLGARKMNVSQYLASIGARGGKSKSRSKAAASKSNGKLGGRPKTKRVARRNRGALGKESNGN